MTFHLHIPFWYTLLPVFHSCFKSLNLPRGFRKFECQSWYSLHDEFSTFKARCREIHVPLRKRKSLPHWFISVLRICHSEYVRSIQSKTRRYKGKNWLSHLFWNLLILSYFPFPSLEERIETFKIPADTYSHVLFFYLQRRVRLWYTHDPPTPPPMSKRTSDWPTALNFLRLHDWKFLIGFLGASTPSSSSPSTVMPRFSHPHGKPKSQNLI
jgi:hypothetical protein